MGRWAAVVPNRDRDPLTGIPPSRHPFQFWILAACFTSGLTSVFNGAGPVLRDLIPGWAFLLWGAVLIFGGGIGLMSAFWKDRITGLLMERTALYAIAGGSLLYSVVLVIAAGRPAYVGAAYTASVGIAGYWRTVHIGRALKVLSRWIDRQYGSGGDG